MLLPAINNQFSLIYLYHCCHKHLLRNKIKKQLVSPDHCTDVNLLLHSTYFCLFRAFYVFTTVAYLGILFGGGGVSTNSVEDRGQREQGSGGGSPLVRCSGGSCNLVQEISFHMVKFS